MSKILGTWCHYNGDYGVAVVLVEGEIGDYAAYIYAERVMYYDATLISEEALCAMCARAGNKLSFTQAKGFFPWIEEDGYRV